ncbi:MAG: DedA family protein [Deltaproteobacteria bacterium]|nr:DedA family protein [Deltaproteobacteria bacterium]MBI3296081.1 DedA family protein [Deltaproteobacteria bacterium]
MDSLHRLIDLFLHLDVHLNSVITEYGAITYLLLFIIVFCETGFVVTPILPGDSLLFAAGTMAALGSLNLPVLGALLLLAAIFGDAVNYSIGRYLGPKVLSGEHKILKKEYLVKTQAYFARYGGKTIVIARFVPIVRTFAPFLAGVGQMKYANFAVYNVVGAVVWVVLFVLGGYFFGNIPVVKQNFTLVIFAIIFLSVLPAVIECIRDRKATIG